jgi:hypothetical protein
MKFFPDFPLVTPDRPENGWVASRFRTSIAQYSGIVSGEKKLMFQLLALQVQFPSDNGFMVQAVPGRKYS